MIRNSGESSSKRLRYHSFAYSVEGRLISSSFLLLLLVATPKTIEEGHLGQWEGPPSAFAFNCEFITQSSRFLFRHGNSVSCGPPTDEAARREIEGKTGPPVHWAPEVAG